MSGLSNEVIKGMTLIQRRRYYECVLMPEKLKKYPFHLKTAGYMYTKLSPKQVIASLGDRILFCYLPVTNGVIWGFKHELDLQKFKNLLRSKGL